MADDEGQTKTGTTEMTGGPAAATPTTPDPAKQPPLDNNINGNVIIVNQSVDAEAQLIEKLSFECMIVRRRFVQKVFGMVGAMLAVVVLMTMLPFVSQNFRIFAIKHSWIWWIAYVFYLVSYISLVCYTCTRRTTPLNYIMTGVLVFSMGWMTIGITIHCDVEIVLIALLMTTICCTAVIIFAMKTNFDMTKYSCILGLAGIVMFIFGIIAIIAALAFEVRWMYTVYAGLMTILMMAYLCYDVQTMMGGKRESISPHDPFYAAVQIFVDIVMMFWYMVQFFQGVAG